MADEDVMRLVAATDADAFEVLYDRHSGPAYSLAYRICGTRPAADEVCQEAFLAVWRSGGRYDAARGSVRSWVLSIVHNRAIDHLRRVTRHAERHVGDQEAAERLPAAEKTDETVLASAQRIETRSLIERLPPEQLRVIDLAFYSGYTHTEIADLLELPLGTVKGRIKLGLAKLRTSLGAPA